MLEFRTVRTVSLGYISGPDSYRVPFVLQSHFP